MTLEKDQPKQPSTRLNKIVWSVTLSVAGVAVVIAIVLAIVNHVKLF